MNTQIKFTYKDVPYVLEYDRNSIKQLESAGFIASKFIEAPLSSVELAFKGAFLKNHRMAAANDKLMDEIYKNLKNKDLLVDKLMTMISETYDTLLAGDSNDEGNIEWDTADLK